jgi:glycosyltransferase involved in cell wall biosynthesis
VTVGFFSPLPPARTGIADYASALLPALARHGRVELNSARADIGLYHVGNNRLHRDIYREALRRPGVVVLHDAVLHHLFLGWLGRELYAAEFAYNYSEWSRDLALEFWRGAARSAADASYFQYPMLRRISEVSRALVVHNPAARRMVLSHAPGARVVEIPHLFAEPPMLPLAEILRLRRRWNIAPTTFLFSILGYLRESKRLMGVLRAFRALRRQGANAALLVAGEFVSSDLERAAAPLLAEPDVVRIAHRPAREFWSVAAAADACINLRHPAAGETSGITVRLMGLGKPVIVSDGDENARFPKTACLRVRTGVAEETELLAYMTWLCQAPEAAREIGRRAACHIREHHSLEAAAKAHWELLQECHERRLE